MAIVNIVLLAHAVAFFVGGVYYLSLFLKGNGVTVIPSKKRFSWGFSPRPKYKILTKKQSTNTNRLELLFGTLLCFIASAITFWLGLNNST